MEDVAARVASLRARAEAAARIRVGAEYARQQAEQAVQQVLSTLSQEFGAESPDQARSLLADLDRKIAAEAEKVERALGAA